ncbi:MAG TPA: Tm-1-like ATP-binding domain-containing protein, partial [Pirellulaceae bacterium]|nr:Tm-1-like ATP-binding domain-containing protein [Pirellulaceae bacterium]
MSVYLLATLDTKGAEAEFVRDRLVELGVPVELVDTSCAGRGGDRGAAVSAAAEQAARLVGEAFAGGKV